ncbi:MAG: pyrroline-5-carboxylate reductase [Spiroplasma sp.]|nr:pyrroline-5-carboxylate reductase [Spiroplasma sp.]
MKIGFLGAGHLGKSIITGLLNSKKYQKKDFKIVIDSDQSKEYFAKSGYQVSQDWNYLQDCDLVILAILPQNIKELKDKLQSTFKKQTIISVASGITLQQLQKILPSCLITRVMPNTSCQFNQSMTMVVSEGNKAANDYALAIFNLLGRTIVLREEKMHTFIAICGSASAYLYYWLQPLMKLAAIDQIKPGDSKLIITNLLLGVAANIGHSTDSLETLQNQVTAPGGTTFEAIKVFDEYHLQDIIKQAIDAVARKSVAQGLE